MHASSIVCDLRLRGGAYPIAEFVSGGPKTLFSNWIARTHIFLAKGYEKPIRLLLPWGSGKKPIPWGPPMMWELILHAVATQGRLVSEPLLRGWEDAAEVPLATTTMRLFQSAHTEWTRHTSEPR